jgi:hypothetical protein
MQSYIAVRSRRLRQDAGNGATNDVTKVRPGS